MSPELRLDAPWSAAPVTPSSVELDLVRLWMSAPHVARHWRQDWPHADWEREVVAQHASVHSRPWIIAKDGEAIAYVEIYRPAIDLVSEWFPVRDGDLGVHIAIGDERLTGRGLGSEILRMVADALFLADAGCQRVLGDPDATNEPACRAFAAARFVRADEVQLPHKRAAIMVRPRRAADEEPRAVGP